MKKQDFMIISGVLLGVVAGLIYLNMKQKKAAELAKVPGATQTDKV